MLVLATAAQAQLLPTQNVIEYQPVSCIRADEVPLLQMSVSTEGDLRAFFRRVSTTDWCSVDGTNQGPLSNVRLPKFEDGDHIEYFFVLLDGNRVIARSPEIYRVKAADRCDTLIARNIIMIPMMCSPNGTNSIPASMGAGFALRSTPLEDGSQFEPDAQ